MRLIALFIIVTACCAQQSPTLESYMASRKHAFADIAANIQANGVAITKPAFAIHNLYLTDFACGSAETGTGVPLFTLAESERAIDYEAQILGPTSSNVIEMNISPYILVANDTIGSACRTLFDQLFNPATGYLHLNYPSLKLSINISWIGSDPVKTATACGIFSGGAYTAFTQVNTPSAPTAGAQPTVDSCYNNPPTSGQGSWTSGKSPIGWLASTYTPYRMQLHEPTTANANMGFSGGSTGTPAMWANYLSNFYAQVAANNASTKVGYALVWTDGNFNSAFSNIPTGVASATCNDAGSKCGLTTLTGSAGQTCTFSSFNNGATGTVATVVLTGTNAIANGTPLIINNAGTGATSAPTSATGAAGSASACAGSGAFNSSLATIAFGGVDLYTDDVLNTVNGMGFEQTVLNSAKNAGLEVTSSEQGVEYWFPNAGVASATYSSGSVPSGTGTCLLSGFNNGATNTTASLQVTNGVAGAVTMTSAGYGATSAPTSASLSNGTLSGCSGTITITSTLITTPSSPNAYLGDGNCAHKNLDLMRQNWLIEDLWLVANGVDEVVLPYSASFNAVYCVYAPVDLAPSKNDPDKITAISYINATRAVIDTIAAAQLTITGATNATPIVFTLSGSVPATYVPGATIWVSQVAPSNYNGAYRVVSVTGSTITVDNTAAPGAGYTSGGILYQPVVTPLFYDYQNFVKFGFAATTVGQPWPI